MGQYAIYLVIGLSITIGLVGLDITRRSETAVTNYAQYYNSVESFSLKSSGINVALAWAEKLQCQHQLIKLSSGKTTLYDGPPAFKDTTSTARLTVTANRTSQDTIVFTSRVSISTPIFNAGKGRDTTTVVDSSVVVMTQLSFTDFQWFTKSEQYDGQDVWYITGDTLGFNPNSHTYGMIHTNGDLYVDGNPYFWGNVTIGGILNKQSGSNPTFFSGYQTGVLLNMPNQYDVTFDQANSFYRAATTTTTQTPIYDYHGHITGYTTTTTTTPVNVYLTFNSNGTVTYKCSSSSNDTGTASISSLAPNGIFIVDGGDAHVQGSVNGKVSVVANEVSGNPTSTTTKNNGQYVPSSGNIWIDNDITYHVNPETNYSSCTDALSLMADNNVYITDNSKNNGADVYIDGMIFARQGSFTVQDYGSVPASGYIHLIGGICQANRGPVGTFSGGHISTGFLKDYDYDPRFQTMRPPVSPGLEIFHILSWYE